MASRLNGLSGASGPRDYPGVRCPVLVGRIPQLAALSAAVEAARSGRGSWLTIVGEAGIGKSRLAIQFAEDLSGLAGAAAVGRSSSVDQTTPHRPLAEALLAAARAIDPPAIDDPIAPYVAAVARFVPHWRTGAAGLVHESPAVLGESFLRVVEWLSPHRPGLLVLDDLHWADPGTIAVCDYLADHVKGARVVIVATVRPDEAPPTLEAVITRWPKLVLGPLSEDDVAALMEACLGAVPDQEFLNRMRQASRGLPLLVEDLLDDGGSAEETRFGALVRQRFEALLAPAQRGVVAAAMLGERFEWHQLVAALCRDDIDATAVVHAATAAQLIVHDEDGMRFRHALTRDVVLGAAPWLRDDLAVAVAEALEDEGGSGPTGRAGELWVTAGDPVRATGLLERAASLALDEGAPEAALGLLDRAMEIAPDRASRTRVGIERLARLAASGRVEDATIVGAGLLDATVHDHEGQRSVRLLLARAALDAGRTADGIVHLDAVGLDASRRAEVLVLRSRAALQSPAQDRRAVAEHLAHQAVAAAEGEGRPALACEALDLAARCARNRSFADAGAMLQRALVVAENHDLIALRLRLLNELGTLDMLRAADGARLRRAFDAAMAVGALDVAAGTALNIAALHAMRGELDAARAGAEHARAMATRLGLRPLAAAAWVTEGLSYGFRGDRQGLERRLQAAFDLAPGDADLEAFAWGAGRGLCALVREERDDAVGALRRAVQVDPPVGSLDTGAGPLLLTLAASGTATEADRDAARVRATPGAGWSDLWLGFGEAALTGWHGDGPGAMAIFGPADVAARRHPAFRAIGLRLLSEAALRDGWGEPVEWLREAEAEFAAGGQERIAAACRSLLKRAGAPATRRRGVDRTVPRALLESGVTAREAEVLTLVAERLTNREIAARLYLSARTVEKHVASLLMKLGATDRAALTEVARRA